MVATEDLVNLVERLRQSDFQVGAEECIAAQNLLLALAASERLPDNPYELRDKLAPIFCSNPDEQEAFGRHFQKWIELEVKAPPVPPATPTGRETPEVERASTESRSSLLQSLRRSRWLLAAAGVLVMALAAALYVLYVVLPTEADAPPPLRALFGQVVSDEHRPVKNASILIPGRPDATSADDFGNFSFTYEPRDRPLVIEVNSPGYQSSRLELDPVNDRFLYLRLKTLPAAAPENNAFNPLPSAPTPTPTPLVQNPVPPIIYTPPAELSRWRRIYVDNFALLLVAVTALPFLVFGIWWVARRYRQRSQLEKWRDQKKPQMDQLPVKGAAENLYRGATFRRTIQELRRHRPFAFNDLDIPLTVEATIKNGGWFKPAYSARKMTPEYLALVDRASFGDQWARQANELIARLKRDGLYVERYYFKGDPRVCQGEDPTKPQLTLQDLAGLYSNHHLLIFSDGSELLSPVTARPVFLSLLEPWQNRALLTPTSIKNWGFRERVLSQLGFVVTPATRAGIAALADAISTGGGLDMPGDGMPREFPQMLRERPWRWLEGAEPQSAELNKLCFQLRLYLGADGYYLLGACAVYPALSWELTVYLGYGLLDADTLEQTFLSLWRLPWFRHEVLPDWLRQRLISDLSPEHEQEVRRILNDLLISCLDEPREGFHLEVAPRQKEERPPLWKRAYRRFVEKVRGRKSRALLRGFIKDEPENPLYEYVFLNFISGIRQRKLAVSVPARMRERLRHLLYPEGMSVFGLRPAAALTAVVLTSLLSLGAAAAMLPEDNDIGIYVFSIGPVPLRSPVLYTITPQTGEPGRTYDEVFIEVSDCARADLQNATLSVPDGSGVSVTLLRAEACRLIVRLSVNADAAPRTVQLFITNSGGQQIGSVDFNIIPLGLCPRLTIDSLTPGLWDNSIVARFAVNTGGYSGPALSYNWTFKGAQIVNGTQYTPVISVFMPSMTPGSQAVTLTVRVGGLDPRCGNTATLTVPEKSSPDVQLASDYQDIIVCAGDPSRNMPKNARVTVEAVTDTWPKPDSSIRTYQWSVPAGVRNIPLLGRARNRLGETLDRTLMLDFSGVPSGAYTVSVTAVGFNGATGTASRTITVRCNSPLDEPCPSLRVSCPAEVRAGEKAVFSAAGSASSSDFRFNWTVSSGNIVSGQGTPTITVDTAGVPQTVPIKATVELAQASGGVCSNSCTIALTSQPTPTTTPAPLSIVSLNVVPFGARIKAGEKASLCYSAIGATKAVIEPDAGEGDPRQDCLDVFPRNTTNYKLTVTNASGETRVQYARIDVDGLPRISAVSPDGRVIAMLSESGREIEIWSAVDRQPKEKLKIFCCVSNIVSLTFSADGSLLGATDRGGKSRHWEVATGREVNR